ncbi:Aste57867_21031 [Aphanomyces stellatus]|uniref:Aste57867_21031 protein n=1 Tax=Aphanomyces stellatus TaxID=120398 RepID=A0A485LHQ6_9STRA|nr:hypothetical protein As57867_020963 [Aphanomyces stellatus]VFT97706.1 Aste57867_21031 [Aphanomyces stellatus]
MKSISELMRLGAAKRTALLEQMGKSKRKTMSTLQGNPVDLCKLLEQETKKLKFVTVVNILKVIRCSFVDSKACMELLHSAELGKVLLMSLKAVKDGNAFIIVHQINSPREDRQNRILEHFLSNLADLFEWDFFAKAERRLFIEEILSIVQNRCNDCDLVLTEALSVFMTMFTTDSQGTLNDVKSSKSCLPLLLQIVYNLPKAKSFRFQALLIEVVYRVLRLLRKSTAPKDQELISKIHDSLPEVLSNGLRLITPKEFRIGTRKLLNEFNQSVRVVQTLPIHTLYFDCNQNQRVVIDDVQWLDIGAISYEIEVSVRISGEIVEGAMKLQFSDISQYSREGATTAKLHLNEQLSLADIIPSVNDLEWDDMKGITAVLTLDAAAFTKLEATLQTHISPKFMAASENAHSKMTENKETTQAKPPLSKSFYDRMAETREKKKSEASCRAQQKLGKNEQEHESLKEIPCRTVKQEIIDGTQHKEIASSRAEQFPTNRSSRSKRSADEIPREPKSRSSRNKNTASNVKLERLQESALTFDFDPTKKPTIQPKKKMKIDAIPTYTTRSASIGLKSKQNSSLVAITGPNVKLAPSRIHVKQEPKSQREDQHLDSMPYNPTESHCHRIPSKRDSELSGHRSVAKQEKKIKLDAIRHHSTSSNDREQLCANFLTKLRSQHLIEGNGLQTVLESVEMFSKDMKQMGDIEESTTPSQSQESNSSDTMSLESQSTPSPVDTKINQLGGNHRETLHVIKDSPRRNKQVHYSTKSESLEGTKKMSAQEMQDGLLGQMKSLVNIILEQQEKYRESATENVIQHTIDKFEKSSKSHSSQLRGRIGLNNVDKVFQSALAQHREQVRMVASLQDEALFNLENTEGIEEELLSECMDLKHDATHNARTVWQGQLKALLKKIELCRNKRKSQLQNKLKDIKDKFNSNDLLAMHTLLGRI